MTPVETDAYHEAGHAIMFIFVGMPLEYVAIGDGPGQQVGGTKSRDDPGPFAPPDGTVNSNMVMVSVAGAIAEELASGVGYGADRQPKTDYDRALQWAGRDGELSHSETMANVTRAWEKAESVLKGRWSHVKALAAALLERKVLTGGEVVRLLLDLPLTAYEAAEP